MIKANRTNVILSPDPRRVLFRPFQPGNSQRIINIIARVAALSQEQVAAEVNQIMTDFGTRHQKIEKYFQKRFHEIKSYLLTDAELTRERQLLLGAYFTQEYSLEASALFNPSIVWHPDQSGLPEGHRRFILSLRATGEGHISSITFRSGVLTETNEILMDHVTRYVTQPDTYPNQEHEKPIFVQKLEELNLWNDFSQAVFALLDDMFTLPELEQAIKRIQKQYRNERVNTASSILDLARSNYEMTYSPETHLSERIVFPFAPNETNGIEDARFVDFTDDNGDRMYYATYTAYNGKVTFPQLLCTRDFMHFEISTLNGPQVENKGMALFPRKINGQYAMLSRQDNENVYIMFSNNVYFWHTKQVLLRPTYSWEFVQLGNCGSPIETDAGWLVLSHGVGPVRKYCIGAVLLDKDDPTKVLGRLKEPLLTPDENEREGYVPNVVYSCGGIVHGNDLIIPYAMADYSSRFATVNVNDLISEILSN